MGHLLKIVDSPVTSPNVRLDLSDGTTWKCTGFDEGVPKLRRAASANAMRDGLNVSSSTRGERSPRAELQVFAASRDAAATQIQTLSRELDRTDNYLMYQQSGSSKPVFFKLFRSDYARLFDIEGQNSAYGCEVEFLAEPYMLGARETLGPFTVNNDPAHASNGCHVDLTGVIGDVATPCVIKNTTAWRTYGLLASRQHGTPSDMVRFKQAESCTLGTDTTNPGGGPDALMSGTGTNNYVTTSFGTNSAMVSRVSWSTASDITTAAQAAAMRGHFRVLAACRRSGVTSTITSRVTVTWGGGHSVTLDTVTLRNFTTRSIVDLGVVDLSPAPTRFPYGSGDASATAADWPTIAIAAARSGGSDTMDWDCIMLVPADEQTLKWGIDEIQDTGLDALIDGVQDDIYSVTGDPFSGGTVGISRQRPKIEGSWPRLVPNQTNRLFVFMGASVFTSPVADANALTVEYWPHYLYIRPSAT